MKILVAGATGFIGTQLVQKLVDQGHHVIALSRRPVPLPDGVKRPNEKGTDRLGSGPNHPQRGRERGVLEWRKVNLYSLEEVCSGMEGVDKAVYLVHSMSPGTRLTQAHFADLDDLLADNFARACVVSGVKHLIYLGGIIPKGVLSEHLKSRLQVEDILQSSGVPVTNLRAGLVIGYQGSSFKIMESLVKKLPLMLCPKWTQIKTQPIALEDVLAVMEKVVNDPKPLTGSFDIGGADQLTYQDLMKKLGDVLNLKRIYIKVPFFSPKISRLWVTTITRSPKELVYPLIESLKHEMVCGSQRLQMHYGLRPLDAHAALKKALEIPDTFNEGPLQSAPKSIPPEGLRKEAPTVTSVQRLPLPKGMTLKDVSQFYFEWLPDRVKPFLKVCVKKETHSDGPRECVSFLLNKTNILLLQLTYRVSVSDMNRQVYDITGGLLLNRKSSKKGRLEFLSLKNECLAAVLDFAPSLPWYVYRYTQAWIHLVVMYCFKRTLLQRVESESIPSQNV